MQISEDEIATSRPVEARPSSAYNSHQLRIRSLAEALDRQASMTDQAVAFVTAPRRRSTIRETLRIQQNVLHALILHDIKARYFGNMWGYLITLAWPLLHLLLFCCVHLLHLADWYGDSMILYVATGTLPLITWHYLTRFVEMGMMSNKSLLNYPIVAPLDILISRLLIETMTSFIVLVIVCTILTIIDIDIVPRDLTQACLGFLSAVLLGYGFAVLLGILIQFYPGISMLWICIGVPAHVFSGIAGPVEKYPTEAQNIIWFNPIMHSIEWIRSSYWADYPTQLLSKTYVLSFGLGALAAGLALERLTRRAKRLKR